jgi:hypothetical protein
MIFGTGQSIDLSQKETLRHDQGAEDFEWKLRERFSEFGIHPHCLACQEPCVQYAAPESRVWCERRGWM